MRWDPRQYGRFAGPRGRAFFELLARVQAQAPRRVVDLGCGPGHLTPALAERWPAAAVTGIDASEEMIAATPRDTRVTFALGTAQAFDATGVDVLISNAMLQWVPDHGPLLDAWAAQLNRGGWLAFQVPANFAAPYHSVMRELAAAPRWRERLDGVLRDVDAVSTPAGYLERLLAAGLEVDAWQTEYQQVLQGEDAVLEWVRGSGLRPVLAALDADAAAAFSAEYAARMRVAYPPRPHGTVFPFRRTFVVAHKP